MEKWAVIPGYERYEASTHGRIRSWFASFGKKRAVPLILKDAASGQGRYRAVVLFNEAGKKQLYVHRLVLSAFVGPPPEKYDGAHLDGNREHNALCNLAWVTRTENHSHKVAHGTTLRGGQPLSVARLTPEEVRNLRSEYRFGVKGFGTQVLAEKYGISQRHAYDIVNNKRWAHLDKEI